MMARKNAQGYAASFGGGMAPAAPSLAGQLLLGRGG